MLLRTVVSLAFTSLALVPSPLVAQATPASATAQPESWVGKSVVDTNEGSVGIVSSYKDGNVYVKTDRHEVPLPASSFTFQDGKLYFAMTREQLNVEYDKSLAAARASLAVGGPVKGSQGAQIGTIEAIDDQYVTIKLDSGKSIRIPRSGIAGSADGAVIGMTEDALKALIVQGN